MTITKEAVVATPPYSPPYAADRAWMPSIEHDGWVLDAAREGFTSALQAAVMMDERDPEMHRQSGVDMVRFRSNRIGSSLRTIDSDIVNRVWDMEDAEVEAVAKWRRQHQDEISGYPRAVLDAFKQDIVDAVDAAGEWDRAAARRWVEAKAAMYAVTARWLPVDDEWELPDWLTDGVTVDV